MNTYNQDFDIEEILIARIQELSSPMTPQPTGVTERLSPLPQVRAVIFDVYGTLFLSGSGDSNVASEKSHAQALREALAFAGFSGNLKEAGKIGCQKLLEAVEQTHAARREEGIRFPEVNIREEWTRVLADLQENGLLDNGNIRYEAVQKVCVDYEFRVNPVWPMPDLEVTLQTLWDRDKLLGIASNAQFYTLLMFPAFFTKSFMTLGFNPFLCAFSYEVREAKPSEKIFQNILDYLLKEFDVSAAETLYVGNDMLNDVWTASQCGLKTALFAGDNRSLRLREDDERCAGLQPDVIVTSLPQILDVVGTA